MLRIDWQLRARKAASRRPRPAPRRRQLPVEPALGFFLDAIRASGDWSASKLKSCLSLESLDTRL